jgi:hypothetical protein
MTPKLRFIFATVLVIAAFVAIHSWAAVTKHESAAPIAPKGTIYRPDLWKVLLIGKPASVTCRNDTASG